MSTEPAPSPERETWRVSRAYRTRDEALDPLVRTLRAALARLRDTGRYSETAAAVQALAEVDAALADYHRAETERVAVWHVEATEAGARAFAPERRDWVGEARVEPVPRVEGARAVEHEPA